MKIKRKEKTFIGRAKVEAKRKHVEKQPLVIYQRIFKNIFSQKT